MWRVNKIRIIVASLMAGLIMIPAVGLSPMHVAAIDAKQAICEGVNSADGGGGSTCNAGGTDIGDVVKLVINILSLVAGVIAVIMIIVGGLKYITSSGDPSSISSAKNTILYAVVGIIVVAFAQLLVRFVFFRVS